MVHLVQSIIGAITLMLAPATEFPDPPLDEPLLADKDGTLMERHKDAHVAVGD